jgi:osomolarity two-component system phosphorelay intermediate protein YPD1
MSSPTALSRPATDIHRNHSVEPSLTKLSSLGHFLKGSSAALGIIKVQASCEKMQHYGNLRDEEVGVDLNEEEALKRIKGLLKDCKRDYQVAKVWFEKLYEEE